MNNHKYGETTKRRAVVAITCLMLTTSVLSGVAFAHEMEMHGKMTSADAQMKKLHAMMPMFSVASARMETAIDKSDAATVEVEGGKILNALPDLKKSTPHKNVAQRKKFVTLAGTLDKTVRSTVELAKKGDFSGAKVVFRKVEETCSACHVKFR